MSWRRGAVGVQVGQLVAERRKRVTVLRPYSVSHQGVAYWPGETPVVPASLADKWLRAGWVTE